MDPFSIAAGIAGFLSLSGTVISTGYTLISKLRSRGDYINALVNEIATLSGILVAIHAHAVAANTQGSNFQAPHLTDQLSIQEALASCQKILKEAEELFVSLLSAKNFKFLLKGMAMKEQADEVMSRLEHYKSFFVLYLQLQSRSVAPFLGIFTITDNCIVHIMTRFRRTC